MYLANPAPDDGAEAASLQAFRAVMRPRCDALSARWAARRRKPRRAARRTAAATPCRPAKSPARRTSARPPVERRRAPARASTPAERTPETDIREAIARLRRRGVTAETLAAFIGVSERTLTRRLNAPGTFSLGEYQALLRAAKEL